MINVVIRVYKSLQFRYINHCDWSLAGWNNHRLKHPYTRNKTAIVAVMIVYAALSHGKVRYYNKGKIIFPICQTAFLLVAGKTNLVIWH